MQHQNLEQSKPSSGFNLSFLKNCACVGRDQEEASQSSRHGGNAHLEEIPIENLSSFSGNEWADIEEIVNQNQGYDLNQDENDFGFNMHNYETLEPIDFDYLKAVTEDGSDSKEGDKSFGSGLSHGSKKISKKKGNDAKSNHESPSSPSPKKGGKKGKRNPWQPHEDAKLLELVGKHGQSWSVLATLIEGRSGKQIRDRYLNILRPNIKKGDWTPQEDQHILALYYQFGHKWSKISSYVPGRTEGQVKNRFYAHIKKKILVNEFNVPGHGQMGQLNLSPSSLQATTAPSTAQNTARHFEFPVQYQQQQVQQYEQVKMSQPQPHLQPQLQPQIQMQPQMQQQMQHQMQQQMQQQLQQQLQQQPQQYAKQPSGPNYDNYQNMDPYNQRYGNIPYHVNQDPTELINYSANNHIHRGGSNENFFSQPLQSPDSDNSTTISGATTLKSEVAVDHALDRMAQFFEKKRSNESMSGYRTEDLLGGFQESSAIGKMERADQLQKRRTMLEFLLQKTMDEMNRFDGEGQNM